MFKKIKNLLPALGLATLPFLSQVTISGGQVGLETSELTTIGTALTDGGTSLLNVGIQLMPYAVAMTVILIVFGVIKNWSRLKNRFGRGRRG